MTDPNPHMEDAGMLMAADEDLPAIDVLDADAAGHGMPMDLPPFLEEHERGEDDGTWGAMPWPLDAAPAALSASLVVEDADTAEHLEDMIAAPPAPIRVNHALTLQPLSTAQHGATAPRVVCSPMARSSQPSSPCITDSNVPKVYTTKFGVGMFSRAASAGGFSFGTPSPTAKAPSPVVQLATGTPSPTKPAAAAAAAAVVVAAAAPTAAAAAKMTKRQAAAAAKSEAAATSRGRASKAAAKPSATAELIAVLTAETAGLVAGDIEEPTEPTKRKRKAKTTAASALPPPPPKKHVSVTTTRPETQGVAPQPSAIMSFTFNGANKPFVSSGSGRVAFKIGEKFGSLSTSLRAHSSPSTLAPSPVAAPAPIADTAETTPDTRTVKSQGDPFVTPPAADAGAPAVASGLPSSRRQLGAVLPTTH